MRRYLAVCLLGFVFFGCDRLRLAAHEIPLTIDVAAASFNLPLEVSWEFDAGAGFGASPFLILGSNLLVATRQGDLVAVSIDQGSRRGQRGLAASIEGGMVRVGSTIIVPATGTDGGLRAYDLATGHTSWQRRTGPTESRPALLGDLVIWGDLQGSIHAANSRTGTHHWSTDPTGSSVLADVVTWSDTAIVFFSDGRVVRVDREGNIVAEASLHVPVHEAPVIYGGSLLVSTTRGIQYIIDIETLNVSAEHRVAGASVRLTTPAYAGANLVLGGADGYVRLIDLDTGAISWEVNLHAAITAAPVIAGNHVIVGAMNGSLVVLGIDDGRVLQEKQLRGRIKSAPMIGSFGLIVASEPRHVYRLTSAGL